MIVDAMGRPTFQKEFDKMGRDAQMVVIKQGIGHLMMGQCLLMEGILEQGGVSNEYEKKARHWLDSFTGKGKGSGQDGSTDGTGESNTGGSKGTGEGDRGIKTGTES